MVKMMNKLLAIFLVFAMAISSATFIDTALKTSGTQESLSTLVTAQQNGTNTFVTFDSDSASDTQNITIWYLTSTYDQKSFTRTLEGTTATSTGGTNYVYTLDNAPNAFKTISNSTSKQTASMYWNLFAVTQPSRRGVLNSINITDTGNNQDQLDAYLNGVYICSISPHVGSTTSSCSNNPYLLVLKGNNNVTVSISSPHNFTETKSNTTAKTGGTGTQTISFTTTPLSAQSNITIYAQIPPQSGVETKYDTDVITIAAEVIGTETKSNTTAFSHNASTEDRMITLVNTPVKRTGGYDYSYVLVYAENISGEVLVSANGDYVGALVNNGTTTWGRDMSDPTEQFLVGANHISFSGTGTADVVNVTLQSYYLQTPSSINGNHTVTMTKAGTGNITINVTKTGACVVSVSLNGAWLGNIIGTTPAATWNGVDFVVGVNNVTYGYATSCLASTITSTEASNGWHEHFTVSLNGNYLGSMLTSPNSWIGVKMYSGVNNISYSSTDTSGNLTNSSVVVLYNDYPLVTKIELDYVYFTSNVASKFEMPDTDNNWTFTSSAPGCVANYSDVYHVVGTNLAYTLTASSTSASSTTNTDDGTTATLYDVTVSNIYLDNNTYLTELWYRDSNGNRVIVAPHKLVDCTNATITNTLRAGTSDITATQYTRSGAKSNALTDIAYVTAVKLSSAAAGSVTVADNVGTVIYTVLSGATRPVDNGGSPMCISSGGCTVTNLFYGGDALWKMSALVFRHDGTNRTALSVFQAAGTGNFGDGVIKLGTGERVVFYGLPYADNTNISINFEVK